MYIIIYTIYWICFNLKRSEILQIIVRYENLTSIFFIWIQLKMKTWDHHKFYYHNNKHRFMSWCIILWLGASKYKCKNYLTKDQFAKWLICLKKPSLQDLKFKLIRDFQNCNKISWIRTEFLYLQNFSK